MSLASPRPLMIGPQDRRLFAALHIPPANPLAGVLVCAPFFHEYIVSYRLFALLGAALAEQGVAVLRFDYYGTGDSGGVDTDFSLAGACADAARALKVLREQVERLPLAILGVRAGVLPAIRTSAACDPRTLWLWQPVDGAEYISELQQRDTAVQPQSTGDVDPAETLDGFPCNAKLAHELREERSLDLARGLRVPITLLDSGIGVPRILCARRINLASSLRDWVGQMDLQRFPGGPVRELARNLANLPELR
ncbi:MAG: alpha/beta hydrolase [Rhodanobacteraceae bacterium]